LLRYVRDRLAEFWAGLKLSLQTGLVLAVLLSGLFWSSVSWAASEQPMPAEVTVEPANRSASDISSEKVSQFVNAYLQVLRLIEQREGILQGAETQSEAQQLEQEVETEALGIIEAAGLTWQEYLQLLGLANGLQPSFRKVIREVS
jgi:Domain of unknown function (DUF4168)